MTHASDKFQDYYDSSFSKYSSNNNILIHYPILNKRDKEYIYI